MIICTKNSDALLKKTFGVENIMIYSINDLIQSFNVDPNISKPEKECFVVTSDDVKINKVKQTFLSMAAQKHPNVRIIFINKAKNPTISDAQGVDVILSRPKPADITNAMEQIMAIGQEMNFVPREQSETIIPEFTPKQYEEEVVEEEEPAVTETTLESSKVVDEVSVEEPITPAPKHESEYLGRAKNIQSMTDATILSKELSASMLLKDLAASNSTYVALENKLAAIKDSIYAIMQDVNIKSVDEKLSQVRGLLHDKSQYRAQADTIIEQHLESIIDTICIRVTDVIDSKLAEIDKAIESNILNNPTAVQNGHIAGLNEERVNVILDLSLLEKDILEVYKQCDFVVMDTVSSMANDSMDLTSNKNLNAQLKFRSNNVISDLTYGAIRAAIKETGVNANETLKELQRRVILYIKKLNDLFNLDREMIAAQQAYINYLKSNDIEETVAASTLIKKSMSIYLGKEGTGKSIIPYLISQYKSRQNANVLHIDLTGTCKLGDYGIKPIDLETYINVRHEHEFCCVVGSVPDTVESAQRLLTALYRAADYYRVINIVLDPTQEVLLNTLAPDCLCINYIVKSDPTNISTMRDVIANTKFTNVARRVILNQNTARTNLVIERLGLADTLDIALHQFPVCETISEYSLIGLSPYSSAYVVSLIEGVMNAKS